MSLAEQARANVIALEVKKDGLRQRQSGDWVLSLVIAAVHMDARIASAAMGTVYECALVETNDDGTPVDHKGQDREKWRDLGPTRQAGMRCSEPIFWGFLKDECGCEVECEQDAAHAIRVICGVVSRKQLSQPSHTDARQRWHDLDNHYQAWKAAGQ